MFKVKEENCIGCGICQSICPGCFVVNNGLAQVIKKKTADCQCDSKEICESCPCQAISFDDKD